MSERAKTITLLRATVKDLETELAAARKQLDEARGVIANMDLRLVSNTVAYKTQEAKLAAAMKCVDACELDAWVAEHVMGFPKHDFDDGRFIYYKRGVPGNSAFHKYSPTTDPAAAMAVLEKCCDRTVVVVSAMASENWHVSQINGCRIQSEAETLPLAICLFAKKLFTP